MNNRDLVVYGALAAAIFYAFSRFDKAKEVLKDLGSAIGSGLFDLFHPDQTGDMLFYTVKFPDRSQHSVPSKSVSSTGRFNRDGVQYQLLVDKGITSGVNKYAIKVTSGVQPVPGQLPW